MESTAEGLNDKIGTVRVSTVDVDSLKVKAKYE